MQIHVPDIIGEFIKEKEYVKNNTGMSESEVLMFDEYVLKIQKRTPETDNEYEAVKWLNKRIPVPEIIAYVIEDEKAYTLMSRISGRMLCDKMYMNAPEILVSLAAEGLGMLWNVDIRNCPCDSRLEKKLKAAEYNVEHGLIDMDNTQPGTFGPDGFRNPEALLKWLDDNRPEEDLVLTHGDFCLPNIFADGNIIEGFIDLGRMGIADRWQDIAICMRSLKDNFSGRYRGKRRYSGYSPNMLPDKLGIKPDEEKLIYYILLDELF